MRRPFLLLLAFVAVQLPWLDRPVDYDETNFLALAKGARVDAWRPHDAWINWQGTQERAFDVLSNPPGIAWFLAPVLDAPVDLQRLWMLLWLPLAFLGGWKLGRRFFGHSAWGAAVALSSPIVLVSTPALLPDAPLYAVTLLGMGGFIEAIDARRSGWAWAMIAGCGVIFRYSALPLVPLMVVYATAARRPTWGALLGAVPFLLLCAHDLHAYGQLHVLAMGKFQSVASTPLDFAHKIVASITMLGGAAALPLFRWSGQTMIGAVLGAGAGAAWGPVGAGFGALGGATLSAVATTRERTLALWAFGGLVFLLTLRFTAARYWLPFLPAVLLALPPSVWRVVGGLLLGTALLADGHRSARAVEALAGRVASLGTGNFTGHWGWQWALERHGWLALDEGTTPPRGSLVALPRQAWPQPVAVACREVIWEGEAGASMRWLPRGYTEMGRANLHASWIAGPPPERTVAPWWFGTDPYEVARVCRD